VDNAEIDVEFDLFMELTDSLTTNELMEIYEKLNKEPEKQEVYSG